MCGVVGADPANDMLVRLIGAPAAARYVLSVDSAQTAPNGLDSVTLTDGSTGKLQVSGASVNAVTFGIGQYFKN